MTTATVYLRPTFGTGGGGGASVLFPFRAVSGQYSATGAVSSAATRRKDWKPDRASAWVDKEGRPTVQLVKFIDYVADVMLGGSNNKTLPQVESLLTYGQAVSLFTDLNAQAIRDQANANAQALDAMKQILIANATPGAAQIPPVQLAPADVPYTPPSYGEGGGAGGGGGD